MLGAREMCWQFAGKTSVAEGQATVLMGIVKCGGGQRFRILLIWGNGIRKKVDGDGRKPKGRFAVRRF